MKRVKKSFFCALELNIINANLISVMFWALSLHLSFSSLPMNKTCKSRLGTGCYVCSAALVRSVSGIFAPGKNKRKIPEIQVAVAWLRNLSAVNTFTWIYVCIIMKMMRKDLGIFIIKRNSSQRVPLS